MIMRKFLAAAALAATLPFSAQAGTLLTTDAGYTGRGLDLSAFANGNYNFTFGPINVDGFTFTAAPGGGGNSGTGSVVGQGGYGLAANGNYGLPSVYIGVDSGTGYAQLLGTTGYSQIGFFMNYAPGIGDDATISTLDAAGAVIESFNIAVLAPISTPGGFNAFEFRGIAADANKANSIYGLRFGGNYILVTGTANGVPNGAVPESSTWAMMIVGFGLAGSALRIRRRKVTFA
jgi:hypothetical protein